MIQSCLKKTIAVVLFVFAVTVFANPAEYLPANAQVYGSINLTQIMSIPEVQKYLPEINHDLKDVGLTVKDLDGTVAFAVDFSKSGSALQVNLTAAFEFKDPIAAQIFNKIAKNDKDVKRGMVAGKPALLDKDDEVRLVQYNNKVIVLEGHIAGKKPYAPLNKNNTLTQASKLLNNQVVLIGDIAGLLNMFNDLKLDEGETIIMDQVKKIKNALVILNCQNKNISFVLVLECNSEQAAKELAKFSNLIIGEACKENPAMKEILSTMYPKQNKKYLFVKSSINISDVEKLLK